MTLPPVDQLTYADMIPYRRLWAAMIANAVDSLTYRESVGSRETRKARQDLVREGAARWLSNKKSEALNDFETLLWAMSVSGGVSIPAETIRRTAFANPYLCHQMIDRARKQKPKTPTKGRRKAA